MSQRAENQAGSPLVFEVEGTEHVPAGPERVLLRVDGRYGDRPGTRVLDAALYIDDGLAVHRHAPLPEPDGDTQSWLWRAAFDIPAHYLTDERTRFALESEPGRLVDLPRRGELVRTPSVPLSARAAHTARRYAVAIAVLVTVAVSPGGLPATARTEVIRVQNPDGSVIYLTADGQQIAAPPADAVIIDQTAPAPEPAPAPEREPEPEPQPEPAPAPPAEPAPDTADAVSTKPEPKELAQPRDERVEGTTRPEPESAGPAPAAPEQPAPAAEAPAVPTDERETTKPKDEPAAPPPLADPAKAEELQQIPTLIVTASDDATELQPLNAVDPDPIPTQGLTDIDLLDAAGEATDLQAAPPVVAPDAPPLIQLQPETEEPAADGGTEQEESGSDRRARDRDRETRGDTREQAGGSHGAPSDDPAPIRRPDGTPTPSNPGYVNALPGPSMPGAVPDFVIAKFRVPPFLLPIYQAAGIQYGIRWEVLAAINEIETDYGRNLNVSSAGALGWMQFMPPTWAAYGVDANKDGKKDPYNPVDAIFAAARYLKASGYENDVRGAIFAYNRADWYVDSVMLRAKLIAGYPADLVGSLTGLTEGRFPVSARARYADDVRERGTETTDRSIDIFAREGAPVVAVNDGIVKKIGYSKAKGRYVVLQDVYGNQYTYSNLGSVAKLYPVPKKDGKQGEFAALKPLGASDPRPTTAASAGSQRRATRPAPRGGRVIRPTRARRTPVAAVKQRLFANPDRPNARRNGGFEQILARGRTGFETYGNYFSRPLGLNSNNATLKPLEEGSRVVGSTVLGRVGAGQDGKAAHLRFEIRPAGRGAPKIDPKPILDGWKLLESTAIYRAKGENVLFGESDFSIGQAMLMPERLLAQRVLSDPRIEIYEGGREDIRTGQIDRRVLIVLTYLAESGLSPTVTSLKAGRSSIYTASGNLSAHPSGNAVDIAAINGEVITPSGQTQGSVTDQAVRRLMQLQGTMAPDQIISLLDYGANTLALGDHDDHIHVGFTPRFGANKLNEREMSVLEPGQWDDLVERLGEIPNPTVPTEPSRYAIPDERG